MTRPSVVQLPVSPYLWWHIKSYKKVLNIVENPSVGSLLAPKVVCELLDTGLSHMLYSCQSRNSTRVRVMCTVAGPGRTLVLEVADDASLHPASLKFRFNELKGQAYNLGGEVIADGVPGGDGFIRLTVPLLSH